MVQDPGGWYCTVRFVASSTSSGVSSGTASTLAIDPVARTVRTTAATETLSGASTVMWTSVPPKPK